MKVLIVGTSFHQEYGGPAISVSRLGLGLARRGVEVGIWAPDGSAVSSHLIPHQPSLRRLGGSLYSARETFGRPNVVHDSGMWLWHNHRLAVLAKREGLPRIVSLRGMLEPWAIFYHGWKKRLAWPAYQRRDLQRASMLHATSTIEAENARALGLTSPVVVVPNGVEIPEHMHVTRSRLGRDRLRALFISRIHPKKGLQMLLDAWDVVRPSGWELVIAGPAESGHDREVASQVQGLGLTEDVSLIGPVYGDAKVDLYRSADLFVLPTHSENFGLVVAEALSYGLPVLTTTAAPWERLVRERCGWWVAPTVAGVRDGLREATALSVAERENMGQRGRAMVVETFNWERVTDLFITDVYQPMLR